MNTLSIVAIILYLAATAQRFFKLNQSSTSEPGNTVFTTLCVLAVLVHLTILINYIDFPDNLNLGFFNTISLTCWLVMVIILVTSIKKPVINISTLMMPLAALAILLTLLFPSDYELTQNENFALNIHIALSLVAYSLLTFAALQALLLAFQDQRIRNKQPTFILNNLPPLQVMEELLVQIIALGFFILSLSLATGLMFIEDIFAQHLSHKIVLSILAWLVFATLLYGRWSQGWRGQTLTHWTISGFVTLLLAYFGSKFVLELLLDKV